MAVGGDDHLPAGIQHRVDDVPEFIWDHFAVEKLHVVDDQQIDRTNLFLERKCRLILERGGETVHEFFGSQIDSVSSAGRDRLRERLNEMRFAEPDVRVNVERIEFDRVARRRSRYAFCSFVRYLI